MNKKILLSVLLALVFVFVSAVSAQNEGGTLTVAIRETGFDTLDPHASNHTQASYIFKQIYDKLAYLGDDGVTVYPGLATSWEYNEDYTVWTLTLREGVTFHDGSPFNAEVLKYNFERIQDPETKAMRSKNYMSGYEKTEILDDYKVEVHFKTPKPLFTNIMTADWVSIISKEAGEKYGAEFFEHPTGSGPFRFVSQVSGSEIVLERNPDYNWAPEVFYHKGQAYLDKLVILPIVEDETRLGMLETDSAQLIDQVPAVRIESLEDMGFTIFKLPRYGIPGMVNLSTTAWPTDDINVRKAMNYGFSRDDLEFAVTKGVFPHAYNVLSRGSKFYDESCELYDYDPEKAVALLEESGWTEINSDGYRVKDGKVLSIKYYTYADNRAEMTAEIFQANMKDIGIEVKVEVVPQSVLYTIADEGSDVNAAFIGAGASDPSEPLRAFYHSTGSHYSRFIDPHVDELLETGESSPDPEVRAKAYSELQCYLMENAVSVPASMPVMIWAASPNIEGFHADLEPYPYFFDVYFK